MDPRIVWRAFWGVAGGLWGGRGRARVSHWAPEGTAKAPLIALGRSWVSPGVSLGSLGPPFWPRGGRPWCCSKMTVFISPLGPDPPPQKNLQNLCLKCPAVAPKCCWVSVVHPLPVLGMHLVLIQVIGGAGNGSERCPNNSMSKQMLLASSAGMVSTFIGARIGFK